MKRTSVVKLLLVPLSTGLSRLNVRSNKSRKHMKMPRMNFHLSLYTFCFIYATQKKRGRIQFAFFLYYLLTFSSYSLQIVSEQWRRYLQKTEPSTVVEMREEPAEIRPSVRDLYHGIF